MSKIKFGENIIKTENYLTIGFHSDLVKEFYKLILYQLQQHHYEEAKDLINCLSGIERFKDSDGLLVIDEEGGKLTVKKYKEKNNGNSI